MGQTLVWDSTKHQSLGYRPPAPEARGWQLGALVYNSARSSVAEELRKESLEEVRRLSPGERVSLALELGDFDLSLFCANQNLELSEALERFRRTRQVGRRTSVPDGNRQ